MLKQLECEFEAEVLMAVIHATWPQGANRELRDHVQNCQICSDAAAITASLAIIREADRSIEIPSSGLVWWRAQLRMRREAAVAAERPMIAVQWIALVCAMALLIAWTTSSLTAIEWNQVMQSATGLLRQHELLIAAMAALLLSVPVVVYFASGSE